MPAGSRRERFRGISEDLYGTEVSPTLISTITDAVLEDVRTWQARPLASAAIPHRAPALGVFLAIKPRIPLAQEFEQVPVLISQIQDHESLAWNVEHMNPHEVVEDPACGRGLNASAFLVREGHLRVLQRSADAVL